MVIPRIVPIDKLGCAEALDILEISPFLQVIPNKTSNTLRLRWSYTNLGFQF